MTADWLLQTCGASSLESVKSVNLWAKSLTNEDVATVLAQCSNLEVASLSLNKISSLHPFRKMNKLKELFLRKNEVADLSELGHLQVCELPPSDISHTTQRDCAGTTHHCFVAKRQSCGKTPPLSPSCYSALSVSREI